LLAEVTDFLDDVPLLIDLDRVDAAVFALIVELAHGGLEGVVDLADAMPQNVGEAKEDRQLDAARLELFDQVEQVNRLIGTLGRVYGDVAGLVDGKVTFAPVSDAVRLQGVADLPLLD